MPQTAEQTAIVQELYRRRDTLPPEKRAIVDELAKRYNLGGEQEPAEQPGMLRQAGEAAIDFVKGAGKGVMSTGLGVSKIIGAVPKATTLEDIGMAPENAAQKAGMFGEQVAEFMLPGGMVARGAKGIAALKGAPKFAPWVARAGLEAASAAGVTAAQTGGDKKEMAIAAALGGAIPLLRPLATGVKKGGEQIQKSLLRASSQDWKDGFDVANIFKYKITGDATEVLTKASKLTAELVDKSKKLFAGNQQKVDLLKLLAETEQDITSNAAKTFGHNQEIGNAVKFFTEEISKLSPSGILSLPDAQAAKVALGKLGAWSYGARDPGATARETVANHLYTKLRLAIEKAAPDIGGINKQLSELIPIERAALRRIPVEARQNLISLSDTVLATGAALDPKWWFFAMINKASKGPYAARALEATGRAGEVAAPSIGRVAVGGMMQAVNPD